MKKRNQKSKIGYIGEELACKYLEEQGMKILEKNCRTRFGEIDIIATCGDIFVFIEVKTKTTSIFGKPFEMINQKKKQRLIRLCQSFLQEKEIPDPLFRIDVVSVMLEGEIPVIKHYKNAIQEN